MTDYSKCPIHMPCVDEGRYLLRRDGFVSKRAIMKRAKCAHMHLSISWDWVREQLEVVFGPLDGVSANFFELGSGGKDADGNLLDANGYSLKMHPEKFLARSRTPTAGWVMYQSDVGRVLSPISDKNTSKRIKGQIERLNKVNVALAKPQLRLITDQSAA